MIVAPFEYMFFHLSLGRCSMMLVDFDISGHMHLEWVKLRKSTASVIVNQSTPRNGIVESSDYFVVSSAWLFQIRVGNTPKVSKSDFVILLL